MLYLSSIDQSLLLYISERERDSSVRGKYSETCFLLFNILLVHLFTLHLNTFDLYMRFLDTILKHTEEKLNLSKKTKASKRPKKAHYWFPKNLKVLA